MGRSSLLVPLVVFLSTCSTCVGSMRRQSRRIEVQGGLPIAARADSKRPNMGLTTWAGSVPRKADVAIAKNYLGTDELEALNRIVTAYLEFAELQALNRRPMHMADWIGKLRDAGGGEERATETRLGCAARECC